MAFLERFEKIILGAAGVVAGGTALYIGLTDDSEDGKVVSAIFGATALIAGGVNLTDTVIDLNTPPPNGSAPALKA